MKDHYVYIMASLARTLYTGVTNDLHRRIYEHKQKETPGFSQRYNATRLAYYESTNSVHVAIAREKQIKGWTRAKKIALIEASSAEWKDLAADWYADYAVPLVAED